MSLANNAHRYHEWKAAASDPDATAEDRAEARMNRLLFERDFWADVVQTISPGAYDLGMEWLNPGFSKWIKELSNNLDRH